MKLRRLLSAALLLSLSSQAQAASPRALELAKRYQRAIHVETTMVPLLQVMNASMAQQLFQSHADWTAAQRRAVSETLDETLTAMLPTIIDRTVQVTADVFSEQQLQALAEFYESPVGQAVVNKMPKMAPATGEIMRDLAPRIQTDVQQRLCRKLDCSGLKAPERRPT